MRSLVSRRYSLVLVRSYGGPWFERSDTLSAVLACGSRGAAWTP